MHWRIKIRGTRAVHLVFLLGAFWMLAACESLEKLFPPANRDPIIDAVFAARPQLLPNDTTIVQARAHDPEGDAVSYEWSAQRGALSTTSGSRVVWTAPASAGNFSINVKVRDGKGGDAEAAVTVSVLSTGPPTIQIIKPAAGAFLPGLGVITIEAIASHPNGIREVEFFAGGSSLGIDNVPPYQQPWSIEGLTGERVLVAKASRFGAGVTTGGDTIKVNIEGVTRF